MKLSEPPKNVKHQPHLLDRPSSVNFCQNFWILSHETVPLRPGLSISTITVPTKLKWNCGKNTTLQECYTFVQKIPILPTCYFCHEKNIYVLTLLGNKKVIFQNFWKWDLHLNFSKLACSFDSHRTVRISVACSFHYFHQVF